jgi:hypothetical protein
MISFLKNLFGLNKSKIIYSYNNIKHIGLKENYTEKMDLQL